jgi:hypothetical protein
MKYVVDMGAGAIINVPSFVEIGSSTKRTHRHTAWLLHGS